MIYDSIDDKNLTKSLWLLKNASRIRLFTKIALFLFILFIYSFFIYNIILVIQTSDQNNKLYNFYLNQNIQNHSLLAAGLNEIRPVELSVLKQGYTRGFGRIYSDFYAEIENTNESYKLSSFDYYFIYNGDKKTKKQTSYLNISEGKYVFVRGIETVDEEIKDAKIVFENLNWNYVLKNPARVKNVDTQVPYKCEFQKNELYVENLKIKSASNSRGGASILVSDFDLLNKSLHNYNLINVKIVFFDRQKNIVYVTEKEIYQLRQGQKQSLSINLPDYLQDVGDVLILPEVDMCREGSYMKRDIINTGI